jgi:hypothetical protein
MRVGWEKCDPPRGRAACPVDYLLQERAELDTPPTTQGGELARFLSYPDSDRSKKFRENRETSESAIPLYGG